MSHHVTAIVPIKEHSERLPNKNFREFNGRPLYHRILEILESVDEIDDIIVNTDADTILETGEDMFDIKVSERPEHLLGEPTTRNIIRYEVDRTSADTYVQTFAVLSALADDFASDLPADTVDHGNKTIPVVEFVFAIFVECLNSVRIVLRCWECCKADIEGIT